MDVVSNKSKGSFNSLVPSNWLAAFLESRKLDSPDRERYLPTKLINNNQLYHVLVQMPYLN